ncbi:hypothetical protein PS634_01842 [Pseudomonas fluorescens]|jgi:hypothetical protein|nr:hypothetical protein PS634_01842 [Pseudomonas fluorescens]
MGSLIFLLTIIVDEAPFYDGQFKLALDFAHDERTVQ